MRTILFRGFNRKNCVWLYGFYLQNRGTHFVCPDEFADGKTWKDYEVDPESVGQFTGLKDKYGHDVYEGDIIELNRCPEMKPRAVVIFDDEHACYYPTLKQSDVIEYLNPLVILSSVIVGNYFDNPAMIDGLPQ